MATLAEKLKALREAEGMTKVATAKKIGVGGSTYSNWEYGNKRPSIPSLRKLSDLFEVPVDYLIDDTFEDAQDEFNRQKAAETQLIQDSSINADPTIKALKGYLINIDNFDDFNIFQHATDKLEHIIEYLCLLSDPNETVTEEDVGKAEKWIDDFKAEIERLSQMRT